MLENIPTIMDVITSQIYTFRLLHFYSIWGIILHVLFFMNIIGNTFPIALFILVGSQILLFIYPAYINNIKINWFYECILHYAPVLLIKSDFSNMKYLYISALLYTIIFNFKIIQIYKNPTQYMKEKIK
jgi:hypothetical protein